MPNPFAQFMDRYYSSAYLEDKVQQFAVAHGMFIQQKFDPRTDQQIVDFHKPDLSAYGLRKPDMKSLSLVRPAEHSPEYECYQKLQILVQQAVNGSLSSPKNLDKAKARTDLTLALEKEIERGLRLSGNDEISAADLAYFLCKEIYKPLETKAAKIAELANPQQRLR